MSSRVLCLFVFLVPAIIADNNIDQGLLQNVFGSPMGFVASASQQVAAVTPANDTLVDPDYWDSEEFIPSPIDYDAFDWTLTKRVATMSPDNVVISPLGLKLALAILTEAATGATQAELTSVLGFDLDRNNVRKKFAAIVNSLRTPTSQYVLDLGSRIYIENNAQPRQRFAAIAEQFYKTDLKTTDFSNPAVAKKEINDWISNATHGKITDLIDEDDVSNTVLLVLNTIYFKGSWRHQFLPNDTRPGTFFVSPSIQKQTDFMNVKDKFYYTESAKFDAKVLRMPYLGHKFSMYIMVPNTLNGLPRLLSALNQFDLRNEIRNLQEHLVDVTIPKFYFEHTSLLDGVLKELGVRQAFEDTASFPGIARGQLLQQRLRISKVLQRSGIEVNELGSIAYSATEIALVNKFGEDGEQQVIANKPFLFFIEDEATRQLLFTGKIVDPSSKGDIKKS